MVIRLLQSLCRQLCISIKQSHLLHLSVLADDTHTTWNTSTSLKGQKRIKDTRKKVVVKAEKVKAPSATSQPRPSSRLHK